MSVSTEISRVPLNPLEVAQLPARAPSRLRRIATAVITATVVGLAGAGCDLVSAPGDVSASSTSTGSSDSDGSQAVKAPSANVGGCPGQNLDGGQGEYVCYTWVGAEQAKNGNFSANGASVDIYQANPTIAVDGVDALNHSVDELWVGSADDQQAIEVGWYKDNVTDAPVLFATHWVDGEFGNFALMDDNDDGTFEPSSSNMQVGGDVQVGKVGNYDVQFESNEWDIFYDNTFVGDFPESDWTSQGTSFTSIGTVHVYTEVEEGPGSVGKTEMGDGNLQDKTGVPTFSDYRLYDSSTPASLEDPYTIGKGYDMKNFGKTSFYAGGPGYTLGSDYTGY